MLKNPKKKIALAVHGGAWEIPDEQNGACLAGVERALERGWRVLSGGGSAADAVEQAVIELEDEPVFDAGLGSHLNRDGRVQLDAILMDGATLKAGAVAAVERIRNPISVARCVCERSPHMMLTGPGAEQFATEQRFSLCDPTDLIVARESERWIRDRSTGKSSGAEKGMGTVGAVALDRTGNLVAGTSTGGTPGKFPGRVGDSPLIGCGCYADNLSGAVSCTGNGENIMKVVLAKFACDALAAGADAQAAAEQAAAHLLERTGGRGGLILVDPRGNIGAAFNTSHMAHAFRSSESEPVIRA